MEDSNLLGEESVHPKECRDPKNVKKFYHRTAGQAYQLAHSANRRTEF